MCKNCLLAKKLSSVKHLATKFYWILQGKAVQNNENFMSFSLKVTVVNGIKYFLLKVLGGKELELNQRKRQQMVLNT